jgi:hypothetical protein
MTAEAVGAWHDAVSGPLGVESGEWLNDQLARRGLMFGARPLCTVLRPRFLRATEYRMMAEGVGVLLGAFATALDAAVSQDSVLAQFRLEPWERDLALADPGIEPSPLSRLDAFYAPEDGVLRFTEYNAETPAGSGYNDALTELFLALPIMSGFRSRFTVTPLLVRHQVLHSLVGAHRRLTGGRTRPTIGILDWSDVPTRSEFLLFQDYFRSMGFECIIADPGEVELRGGALVAAGARIDVIYKRVLINELIERGGVDHPIVRAVQTGAVCMVNPFRCKILHKKASLAVLSDERNERLFSSAEREIIARHVPWTRVVEDRATMLGGRRIDLLPYLADNKDILVLKPNDDYGGAGVVLGWEVDASGWNAALKRAVEQPHIVQRRIGLPEELFPSLVEGGIAWAPRILDTAPFCFDGSFVDGCLTRVSTAELVNVTAGGGSTVPTMVVEPR